MGTSFLLGKFLPPHIGHQYLFDFAMMHPRTDKLVILVATMKNEPIEGIKRYLAIKKYIQNSGNSDFVDVIYGEDDMPQEPADDPNFWEKWINLIERVTGQKTFDTVFASENYGAPLAEKLNAKFIPVDIGRDIFPVSGTNTRHAMAFNFPLLLEPMKKYLAKQITIFGSESCGKTTMARALSRRYARWIPEYARGYLDAKGITSNVTIEHMVDIVDGQIAAFDVIKNNPQTLYTFRDTDLYTTLGYWDIMGFPKDIKEYKYLLVHADYFKADHYFVMDTDIPFEPDHLRYGGNVRTSETKYWTDLLDRENVPYTLIGGTDYQRRAKINSKLKELYGFD